MDVLIYTTPTCGYCRQAKEYLKTRNVPFAEKNVAADGLAAQEMVQRTGQRGVPVLVINGQTIIGFDRGRIDAALAQQSSPRLGAAVADAAGRSAREGQKLPEGAYIGKVNAGSPAERAGLQVGDVLVALGGQSIRCADDVQRTLSALTIGQTVTLGVWRAGQRIQLQAKF